ncbi:putative fluoride ion transporter CrcB [Catellatospora methionotrophica]|uniref:Fluoride-specific ion channel FluC n=1 Tax=Catellatospora methionotrophica TaxID=121620 RepID=A0A8J3PGH7_9ACTN|nr:fluoride efflux transporter CrcB [Catellatospora methionotrophica]GIG16801.1 putative fluoride ion transporter CrcB [Catellatospora methionotrophica]
MTVVAVLLGGGLGATLRYLLGLALAPPTPPDFPWVTFAINVVGAFALGAVMTMLTLKRLRAPWAKPFLSTGLIGGFTTWSHFIVEADQLIGARQVGLAVTYLVVSIVVGVAAAAAGAALVERLTRLHSAGA